MVKIPSQAHAHVERVLDSPMSVSGSEKRKRQFTYIIQTTSHSEVVGPLDSQRLCYQIEGETQTDGDVLISTVYTT